MIFGSIVLAGVAALAQAKTPVVPEGFEEVVEAYHYSPAVRVGNQLYLSGVMASVPKYDITMGGEVDAEAMAAAFRLAFQEAAAVLEEAGASWDDVVDITTFHTDIDAQIYPFAAIKDEFIKAPYPAWTAIDVDRLFSPEAITEIKLIAIIPESAQ